MVDDLLSRIFFVGGGRGKGRETEQDNEQHRFPQVDKGLRGDEESIEGIMARLMPIKEWQCYVGYAMAESYEDE